MPPGTISYTVRYDDFYPRPFMVAKFNLKTRQENVSSFFEAFAFKVCKKCKQEAK
jgi:hypothetical protein